jgi:primosomal protein N' (replication factor Y)
LSEDLCEALRDALNRGSQAILLHNRRGFALQLRCKRCGSTIRCDRCDARMVVHRHESLMKCHACGRKMPLPSKCPDSTCGGELALGGRAIQHLESELERLLPQARILRLDSDMMKHRDDYEAALSSFERHEADILLGTQMVAKGLDFPNVALVGVIEADASIHLPDFRAAERTFQLVAQVIGRAGRREGRSTAIIQTSMPDLPAIRLALSLDYERFAKTELAQRRRHGYPPYTRLIRWVLSDARPGRARSEAETFSHKLRESAGRIDAQIRITDAGGCTIPRRGEAFRYEVLAFAPPSGAARRLLEAVHSDRSMSPSVQRLTVDVDPIDLM